MQTLNRIFDRISRVMARISSVFLCIVCFSIIVNIVGRVFNSPVQGSMEIIQYGMLIAVAFGLCRTGFLDKHIFVSILLGAFPKKVAACIRCFTLVITAAIFGYLVYYFINEIPVIEASARVTEIFRIPYTIIYGILAFGMLVTTVLFVYQAIYVLRPMLKNASEEDETVAEDAIDKADADQ